MREKTLDARLSAIVSLIREGDTVADIGSDHAYIPLHLIKNKICKDVLVTDIRKGPLEAARKNFNRFGFGDLLVTMQYDGIREDVPARYSTVIIAGMGGLTICGILKNAAEQLKANGNTLILQPMTEQDILREFLKSNGFAIEKEIIAKTDNGKLYNIIKAKVGASEEYSECEYRFGKYSLCETKELYGESVRKYLGALVAAREHGATDKAQAIESVENYLSEIEKCRQ